MFNILIIALLDFRPRAAPISSQAHQGQVLTAGFGILLLEVVALTIFAGAKIPVLGWFGITSIAFILIYLFAMRTIFSYEKRRALELPDPTYQLNDQHQTALGKIDFKFRIYDLPHTFATRLLENGKTDLLTLASILGHSNLDQVMRYAHPSEKRKAEAVLTIQQKQSNIEKTDVSVTLLDT